MFEKFAIHIQKTDFKLRTYTNTNTKLCCDTCAVLEIGHTYQCIHNIYIFWTKLSILTILKLWNWKVPWCKS